MRQPKCECGECVYCIKRAEYLKHRESYIERSKQYQKEHRLQTNDKNARWKRNNRDKVSTSQAQRRVRHRQLGSSVMVLKDRRSDLKKNYGVTLDWFNAKLVEQGRGCAICGVTENNARNRNLHVDHCHLTNHNRGILCHRCNTALERMETVEDWELKARAYLAKYESEWDAKMQAKFGY